jgi:hypothetical protein
LVYTQITWVCNLHRCHAELVSASQWDPETSSGWQKVANMS